MRKRDFERLMALLANASPAQLRAAESRLSELNSAKAGLLLAEERMACGASCPHCGRVGIARQSTWQGRVNHDGKGSRGIWIMPLMIVAGKRYVED